MSRSVRGVALLLLLLAFSGSSLQAQDDTYLPTPTGFDRRAYEQLLGTESAEPTPQQKEDSKTAAEYVIYPLTDFKLHREAGKMARTVDAAESFIQIAYSTKSTNTDLRKVLHKELLTALDRILANKRQKPIARLNAARVLAFLANRSAAESTIDQTIDQLVKVMASADQSDGARYWAFRGVSNVFARRALDPEKPIPEALRKKVVEVLVPFIERSVDVKPVTPQEEKEGLRVLRREALRALTQVRDPGPAKDVKRHAALTLARVVRGDKALNLEPRLDEQVEAAVGLGLLRADPDVQPAYLAHNMGKFLDEFIVVHNKEKSSGREPWRVHAARIEEALTAMYNTHANREGVDPAVKKFLTELTAVAVTAMQDVQKGGSPNPVPLREALKKNPPAQTSVYKSDPKSAVSPREEG